MRGRTPPVATARAPAGRKARGKASRHANGALRNASRTKVARLARPGGPAAGQAQMAWTLLKSLHGGQRRSPGRRCRRAILNNGVLQIRRENPGGAERFFILKRPLCETSLARPTSPIPGDVTG